MNRLITATHKTIQLAASVNADTRQRVYAECYGDVAIHRREDRPSCCVVHIPSGRAFGAWRSIADAKALVREVLALGLDLSAVELSRSTLDKLRVVMLKHMP